MSEAPGKLESSDLPRGIWCLTLVVALIIGLATRAKILFEAQNLLHADEAILGLMGLDFAAGGEWQAYFSGQGYMGSVIATLAWPLLEIAGPTVVGIRLIELGIWTGSALIVAALPILLGFARPRLASLLASLLYCLASISMQTWSLKFLGHQEPHTLALAMVACAALAVTSTRPRLATFCACALAALSFWALPISLYAIVPVLGLLGLERRVDSVPAAAGVLVGGLPWLYGLMSTGATGLPSGTAADHLAELPSRIYNLFVMCGPLWGGITEAEVFRIEVTFQLGLWPSLAVIAVLGIAAQIVLRSASVPIRALGLLIPVLLGAGTAWRFHVAPPEFQVDDPWVLAHDLFGLHSLGTLVVWALLALAIASRFESFRRRRLQGGRLIELADLPVLLLLCWIALWCSTGFGKARAIRYLLFVFSAATLCLAQYLSELFARRPRLVGVILALLLSLNLASTRYHAGAELMQPIFILRGGQSFTADPSNLIAFLDQRGIQAVVGKYHFVTQIGFLSGDRIATSALKPGRLPDSDRRVAAADRWAVLMQNDSAEARLWRSEIRTQGIESEIRVLDGFMVAIHEPLLVDHPSHQRLVELCTREHGR